MTHVQKQQATIWADFSTKTLPRRRPPLYLRQQRTANPRKKYLITWTDSQEWIEVLPGQNWTSNEAVLALVFLPETLQFVPSISWQVLQNSPYYVQLSAIYLQELLYSCLDFTFKASFQCWHVFHNGIGRFSCLELLCRMFFDTLSLSFAVTRTHPFFQILRLEKIQLLWKNFL